MSFHKSRTGTFNGSLNKKESSVKRGSMIEPPNHRGTNIMVTPDDHHKDDSKK